MKDTESQKPEQEAVVNGEAVDEAEHNFAISKEAQSGIGVMLTIDKSQAIEQQHDG